MPILRSVRRAGSFRPAPWLASSVICALTCSNPGYADDGTEGVRQQLDSAAGRFTPEIMASFLATRRADALRELAQHGISIPDSLLAWIDETPVAASTVYGIRHGTPAQVLVLLRSLELDLGSADIRAHSPIVFATAVMHAPKVDLANPGALAYVSLEERGPLELKIPGCPLVEVNTHPEDRPLDAHDHVINFMEEEEVVENGKVVAIRPRENPIRACDIVASKALQAEFNAYMADRTEGFKPLDCGEQLHWKYGGVSWRLPERKELGRAWELFYRAYVAKGRLPAGRDPMPTPAEWAAYQIRNAKTRGVVLPDVWPFAMCLASNPQPLREAEFAWEEKAKGLRPMRYVEYVGKVAQDVPMLRLRRLTPFKYGYGSLAMMRKDGGVCGTHTGTAMRAGASLGQCVVNCASPGHSFPGSMGKGKDGVYTAPGARTGVKWYFGAGEPEGIGADGNKLTSLAAAMNWGIQGFVDSQLGWTLYRQLPEDVRAIHGYALLKSALMLNPYNVSLARATLETAGTAEELIALWEDYQAAIHSAKDRKGCIQTGRIVAEVWDKVGKGLEPLPVPEDAALRDRIYAAICRQPSSPGLRATYERETKGIDAVLMSATRELTKHVNRYYRPATECTAMAAKLQAAIDLVEEPGRRRTWAEAQVATVADRGLCLTKAGKRYVVKRDEAVDLLLRLAGTPVDEETGTRALLDLTTTGLKQHIESRRTTPACKDMATRLRAVIAAAEGQGIDLTSWAETWFGMMEGKQAYARHSWCQKDAASVVLDELKARYPGNAAEREGITALEDRRRALQQELEQLNRETANGQAQERINEINRAIDNLAEQIDAAKRDVPQPEPEP